MSADESHSPPTAARKAQLRHLPRVDALLDSSHLAEATKTQGRGFVAHHVRHVLEELRHCVLEGTTTLNPDAAILDMVAARVKRRLLLVGTAYPRIINASGVILHSGLGRAPMPQVAVDAAVRAGTYGLLEVERGRGDRLSRDTRAGELLHALTGAEASMVVNNNAAATLLILSAVAGGREVICSRGEMVEIGGSYRIPDVMEASGCKLVEVGTTNKTHLPDYERAITENTGALLVVHTSNYRVVGFTHSPELSELAELAREHNIPLIHDIGSGSLLSPEELGLGDEPPVGQSLESGADVVCMSGDKILGGPQAGIILGRKDLIQKMRKHPLARALRINKSTVAALEATLQLYFDPERLKSEHPVCRMLMTSADELRPRAEACAAAINSKWAEKTRHLESSVQVRAEVIETTSETGSGALPTLQIPSVGVALDCHTLKPDALARALRHEHPGIFSRIIKDRVTFDLRTLFPGEELELASLVVDSLAGRINL